LGISSHHIRDLDGGLVTAARGDAHGGLALAYGGTRGRATMV